MKSRKTVGRGHTSSKTVAISTLWNLMGRGGPLLLALVTTPILVHELGPTRWGVFSITLALVGFFGFLDFGFGPALTRVLAQQVGEDSGEDSEAGTLAKTGLVLLAGIGTVTALVAGAVVYWWAAYHINVASPLRYEILAAMLLLCLAIPLYVLNAALWGIIAAHQRFRDANLHLTPVNFAYYLAPVLMLRLDDNLVPVMAVLLLCRVVITGLMWRICTDALPSLRGAGIDFRALRPLLRMGGWMTVSNLLFPVLSYMERFVLASVVSPAAIGYYSTPSDLLMRSSVLSIALMTSAYPAMAATHRTDPANTARIFRRSALALVSALLLPALVAVGFSKLILTLWINASFAGHAYLVMSWLGLGVLVSAADGAVAHLLDSVGHASINARFSLCEVIIYLPVVSVLVHLYGIEGAAMAWSLRSLIDFLCRLWLVARLYEPVRGDAKRVALAVLAATGVLILPSLWAPVSTRLIAVAGALAIYAVIAWLFCMRHTEREMIKRFLGKPFMFKSSGERNPE